MFIVRRSSLHHELHLTISGAQSKNRDLCAEWLSVILLYEVSTDFIIIFGDYLTNNDVIIRLCQYQWRNITEYGRRIIWISNELSTTKQNRTVLTLIEDICTINIYIYVQKFL